MRFEFPQRLSATGIVGLAALSTTQWLREHVANPGPVLAFGLGAMPNLAAAFAMPLVLASLTPRTARAPTTDGTAPAFLAVLTFTTCGLVAWELIQTRSARFVFDLYDIAATGLGALLAYVAYRWHVRIVSRGSRSGR